MTDMLRAPLLPQEVNGQVSFQRIRNDGGLQYLLLRYSSPDFGDVIRVFLNGRLANEIRVNPFETLFPISGVAAESLLQYGSNIIYFTVTDGLGNVGISPSTTTLIDTTPGFLTAEVITDRVQAGGNVPVHLRYFLESWQGYPIGLARLEFTVSGTAVTIPTFGNTNSRGEFDLRVTNQYPGFVTVQCYLASNRNVKNNTDVTFI